MLHLTGTGKLQSSVRLEKSVSSSSAKNASSDDMSGLEPVVFLAKTVKVMLTKNLWSHVGLCNGATRTVRHIIYDNGHRPPNLRLAVIVEFDNLEVLLS